jgi:hypothetical protein
MADKDKASENEGGKAPEFDGEFDADRAKRAIANLRAEVDTLKASLSEVRTERDALKADADERANEGKTEAEKAAQRAAEAEATAKAAKRELWIERALRKHPEAEDLADLITGDDEETIMGLAERLAKRVAKSATDEGKGNEPDPLNRRPEPTLKPGHGGSDPEPFDAAKIAAEARAAAY